MDPANIGLLLLWLVIIGCGFYVLWWALGKIALPEPFNKLAIVVLVVLTVLALWWLFAGSIPAPRSVWK